jgi:hypothetical protein
MRPASRRALLRRLAAAAPPRTARTWSILALLLLIAIVVAHFALKREVAESTRPADAPNVAVLDPVLALPFGSGNASPPTGVPTGDTRRVEELRTAFRRADDRQALYAQWRDRPETDARYLAFRAARDCELVRAGGALAEPEALSERRGERERQMAAATARCRGFGNQPATPDELQRIEQEAAAAGHPAAQIALATETFAQRPLVESLDVVRRGLATGDPLAFDEARLLLAMSRHQVEIAGVPPTAPADIRTTDARVAALDLAGCRLGNPCAPSRGAVAIDCGDNAACLRDAEEWLLQMAELDGDERRTVLVLTERLVSAFRRGAIDEIVRVPAALRAPQQ